MAILTFRLNEHLFLRDPQSTQLGQTIIRKSIELIDRLGIEQFTFKKLAEEINSTEASVYRYFENKHRLLLYLISWYWSWVEYHIDRNCAGVNDPEAKLKACLHVLAGEKKYDPSFEFVDEAALHRIVVSEWDKAYLTKAVDEDNREGLFSGFKSICKKIADMFIALRPDYAYPNALASTVLITSNQQLFFASHLKSLTNIQPENDLYDKLYQFLESITFGTLKN